MRGGGEAGDRYRGFTPTLLVHFYRHVFDMEGCSPLGFCMGKNKLFWGKCSRMHTQGQKGALGYEGYWANILI